MIKKTLMILLIIVFVFALGVLFMLYKNKVSPSSVSVPLSEVGLSPSPTFFPSPFPASTAKHKEIENDLIKIEEDLRKIKEDKRINPPEFLFDLGI